MMEPPLDGVTPATTVTRRSKPAPCEAVSDDLRGTFVENLKAARADAGFSQRALASKADVSQVYISQIEAGTRNVTLDMVTKLARVLGKRPGEMLKPSKSPARKK